MEAPPARNEPGMASEQVSTRSKSKRSIENATNEIENEQESMAERNDGDPGDGNQTATPNQKSGNGVTATLTNATNAETTSTATSAASTIDTSKKRKPTQTKQIKPPKKRAGGMNTNKLLKTQNEILSDIETWYERATFGRPIDAQMFGEQLEELLKVNKQLRTSGLMTDELREKVEKAKKEVATVLNAIDKAQQTATQPSTSNNSETSQSKDNDDKAINTKINKTVAATKAATKRNQVNNDESEQGTRQEDLTDDNMTTNYGIMIQVNTRTEEKLNAMLRGKGDSRMFMTGLAQGRFCKTMDDVARVCKVIMTRTCTVILTSSPLMSGAADIS